MLFAYTAVGILIFARKANEWIGLFSSLTLITTVVVLVRPGDSLRLIVGNITLNAPPGILKIGEWQHLAATANAATVFAVALGAFTMLLGVLLALGQDDLKRMLAYSSVSQMGYVLAGLGLGTYLGCYGGLFHLVNHAIEKSLLFMCVGAVIYATGYVPNLDYLTALGALDMDGQALHRRGVSTTVPRLAYVGLHNQWTYASATLRGVGPDAAYVVSALRRQLRVPHLENDVLISLRQRIALSTGCCAWQGDAR